MLKWQKVGNYTASGARAASRLGVHLIIGPVDRYRTSASNQYSDNFELNILISMNVTPAEWN